MLTVATFLWHDPNFKWGSLFHYTPRHVDRLARAVKENLHIPHRFIVITDQEMTYSKAVDDVIPLWDDFRELGSCYTRLKCFDPAMHYILGDRFVWLDLDCMICGDLTPLFSRPEDFIVWRPNYHNTLMTPRRQFCGSMLMMDAGCRPQVWEEFNPETSPQIIRDLNYVGSDQAWITYVLGVDDEASWSREDGVLSFRGDITKHNSLPGREMRLYGRVQKPKEDARILFFHGNFDISMPMLHKYYPWIKEYWDG